MKLWVKLTLILIAAGCTNITSQEMSTVEGIDTLVSSPTPNGMKTNIPPLTLTATATQYPLDEAGLIVTLGKEFFEPGNSTGSLVFSPDGQMIAHAGKHIRFWDMSSHKLIRDIENPYARGCTIGEAKFSPDGTYFAVSNTFCSKDENSDSFLLIWDSSTGELIQEWKQEYAEMPGPEGREFDYIIPVDALAFIPDSSGVIFASGHTLVTSDILHKEEQDVLDLGATMYATEISLSSDGSLAYVIMSWIKDHDWASNYTVEHRFQVWDLSTHTLIEERGFPKGWAVLSLRLLGSRLLQIDYEKDIKQLTDLETGEVRDHFTCGEWGYFNTDLSLMIVSRPIDDQLDDNQRDIELWNFETCRKLYSIKWADEMYWLYHVSDIVFSPDNTILAFLHEGQVTLWNIRPFVLPKNSD